MEKYEKIWKNMEKYEKIWKNMEKYEKIWEIWENMRNMRKYEKYDCKDRHVCFSLQIIPPTSDEVCLVRVTAL